MVGQTQTCRGLALRVGQSHGEVGSGDRSVALELGTLLAEFDVARRPVVEVQLLVRTSRDWSWVPAAVRWLEERGRRVVVRARHVVPAAIVDALESSSVLVMLELASHHRAIQQALLGSDAASATSLLFHAQHLRSRQIPVAAWVGPILPGLHETSSAAALWKHIAAADIRDGHAGFGMLTESRLSRLENVLPSADLRSLVRAFRTESNALTESERPLQGPIGLPRDVAMRLRWVVQTEAAAAGVRLDECGCASLCHLTQPRRDYVSLATAELFPQAS